MLFCLKSGPTHDGQIEVRMHGVVRKDQSCFLGVPCTPLWIELNHDLSLPTGRDYPIEPDSSAASVREYLLDREGCISDVFHDEGVRILASIG